ncbi:MAG: flavodoxin family protein [Heliobacteriaceae bacterium]|nr:flavodoxin family protein [Heliobacteriaceae bacterium]
MTEKVKLLGIAGSPRHGNTEALVAEALKAGAGLGPVETELISLANLEINGCIGCNRCYGFKQGATWERMCYQFDDDVAMVYKKIAAADGLIVGSPVYTFDVTSRLKALMERGACFCHYSASPLSGAIRNKVVGGLVVAFERRGGQESALASIWRWATGIMFSMVVGAVPFPEDPPPQASGLGGLADTCDSSAGLSPQGAFPETTRTTPPTSGEYNLRSVRNMGRTVAMGALMVKRGTAALQAEGITVPPVAITAFPRSLLKEGSYLARLRAGEIASPPYQTSKRK